MPKPFSHLWWDVQTCLGITIYLNYKRYKQDANITSIDPSIGGDLGWLSRINGSFENVKVCQPKRKRRKNEHTNKNNHNPMIFLMLFLRVNFAIYTENSPPTMVDHGFPQCVSLAFSGGNHYGLLSFCLGTLAYTNSRFSPLFRFFILFYSLKNRSSVEQRSLQCA